MINHGESAQKIAIFVFDGMSLFEFGIAVELFVQNRCQVDGWYETFVVSQHDGSVKTSDGVRIAAECGLESLSSADKILVPGWRISGAPDRSVTDSFKTAYDRGAELISFCTGAFAIAATGLLDHRRATTHWAYSETFTKLFPDVELVDGVLFVNEGRIATSAGSAAAMDLGLHIIRRDYGVEVANRVAQRMVIAPARNGHQRQYVERPIHDEQNCLVESIEWARRNLPDQDMTVAMMASVANLSRRSFDRNFRKTTGQSPNAWITEQRLNLASELLESTSHSIERVASLAGFGSTANFRQKYGQQFGIPPSVQRKTR